ncbi:hypothetical protein BXZ70DRAFT_940016 [Cristinia sonorae]|uniref:F-box domain-containing protein n=1 Tax=Cristinia sonorae TaxID=1940300 RepID=A0A8K0XPK7_9AGAR|nr:hypothetical protein BXZ70DRAFT_940016 [Cristinia sonorae]
MGSRSFKLQPEDHHDVPIQVESDLLSLGSANIDEYRERLQDQVDRYIHAIADLRFRMNNLIAIARLPPEILASIFSWLFHLTKPADPDSLHYSALRSGNMRVIPVYPWIHITHVCHYWREVALNTPSLWTNLFIGYLGCHNPEVSQAFILRSKQALLHLHVTAVANPRWSAVITSAMHEIVRAESLDLMLFKNQTDFIRHIPSCAPHLRTLVVKNGSPAKVMLPPFSPPPLPVFLKDCATPVLTQLQVNGFGIEWVKGMLPKTLTDLRIKNVVLASGSPCSDVLEVVTCLPLLQHLELHGVFEDLPDPTPSSPDLSSRTPLPHLQMLDIWGPIKTCIYFLNHFILPVSAAVLLKFYASVGVVTANSPVVSTLSSRINDIFGASSSSAEKPSARLVINDRGLWFSTNSSEKPRRIRIAFTAYALETCVAMTDLCSFLPMHHISRLAVSSFPTDDRRELRRILSNLQTVETVRFRNGCSLNVISDLLTCRDDPPTNAGTPSVKPVYYFPKLKTVELDNVSFRHESDSDYDDSWRFVFVKSLFRSLRQRKKDGYVVQHLRIKKCANVDKDDVEMLEEEVIKVTWDHWVRDEDASSEGEYL